MVVRSCSRGEHAAAGLGQFIQHLFFDVPKGRLALALKKFSDGATQALFDHMVRVDKAQPLPPGQLAAHGGLA